MKYVLKRTMTAKELYDYFEEAKSIGLRIRDDIFVRDRSSGSIYSLYYFSQVFTPELYLGTVFDIEEYTTLKIKNVIFNGPATIVYWSDGSKTVVKCQPGKVLDYEKGLAMAISKKMLGNRGSYYDKFNKWVPEEEYVETDFVTVCENIIKGLADIASMGEDDNDKTI